MRLSVTADQCAAFPGKWSLWPAQMFAALNEVTIRDGIPLMVMELGSGAATDVLASILQTQLGKVIYLAYENNADYISKHPVVSTYYWDGDVAGSWFSNCLARYPGPYDLIIIDGPNGVDRAKWYPMLRDHIRPGAILIIDDFDHYTEFQTALDELCEYDVVDRVYAPSRTGMCWITVRVK